MDPTLRVVQNRETREQVVYGMGQLHLDITGAYVKKKTGVVCAGKPEALSRQSLGLPLGPLRSRPRPRQLAISTATGPTGAARIEFVDAIVGGRPRAVPACGGEGGSTP
jgi:hypothetical protein